MPYFLSLYRRPESGADPEGGATGARPPPPPPPPPKIGKNRILGVKS